MEDFMIKMTMFTVTATLLAVVSPAFAAVARPAGAAARPIKECRSREDWLAQGFDPLAK
jgi:hypothetical protein